MHSSPAKRAPATGALVWPGADFGAHRAHVIVTLGGKPGLAPNSGHEFGPIGLDDFIARRSGWETKVTWIHYGANIGAAGSRLVIQSNQDDLRALAVKHLSAAGQKPDSLAEKSVVPTGETRDIHRAGGRYLTIGAPPATSALFHLPDDRWPHAVDVGAIARAAEGMAAALVALTR